MAGSFHDAMAAGYVLAEPSLVIGSPMDGTTALPDVRIQVALSMLNRHGLIAGATGTGKTKTLQLLAGQLSMAGVPVLIADIKGDLTGLALPGDATNAKVMARAADLGLDFRPDGHPVEFLSLSGKLGAQGRATVHSFGPLLLGRVLGLNDTQTSILAQVFKCCDDHQLPLLDIAALTTPLKYQGSDDGKAILADYVGISAASLGVMLRAIITLEQQGADVFFGEPEFDVDDLMRVTPGGQGIISVLELPDVMEKPALFSTFMLWMLAQLYHALPEAGDLPKPKLCFFFDEAHLLFDGASNALLAQIEQTVRLIRSKGVGVYFVTQVPTDVPSSVLAQLGNRVQHALRVFTPEDADSLKKTVRTFPMTDYFETGATLTSLGIGEALVTVLSPRGVPTPLAPTRLLPPDSLMAALPTDELQRRPPLCIDVCRDESAQPFDHLGGGFFGFRRDRDPERVGFPHTVDLERTAVEDGDARERQVRVLVDTRGARHRQRRQRRQPLGLRRGHPPAPRAKIPAPDCDTAALACLPAAPGWRGIRGRAAARRRRTVGGRRRSPCPPPSATP